MPAVGARLALENAPTVLLATGTGFIEIGPRLPESVGFAFDLHHAARAGVRPMLLLRHMRGRLFDVHLRDFDEEGHHTGNILPEEGSFHGPAALRSVRGADFDGPFMLESVLYPSPARSVAAVRKLLDPLDRCDQRRGAGMFLGATARGAGGNTTLQ